MEKAIKADTGKPSFSMIPQLALLEVAKTFTYGANKYGKFNYSKGMEMLRLLDAAQRHINQCLRGEDIDEESQCFHLSNAVSSLLMALEGQLTGSIEDDRNKVQAVVYYKGENK